MGRAGSQGSLLDGKDGSKKEGRKEARFKERWEGEKGRKKEKKE